MSTGFLSSRECAIVSTGMIVESRMFQPAVVLIDFIVSGLNVGKGILL